ncbi:MAG: competence protein [Rikenellaceae bacterium]|nr:competence protein [Rikenellaceae bacterium]
MILIAAWLGMAFPVGASAAPDFDRVWNEANEAYTAGRYGDAIAAYDSIRAAGCGSAKLFYNLGNACFKDNRIGPALLNYYRAQRLAPGDADIDHNLRVANAYVVDRIETVPVFFLKRWVIEVRSWFGSNGWAWLSLVWLTVGLCAAGFYLLSGRIRMRRFGFYGGIVCLALFLVSAGFAAKGRRTALKPDEAVVMARSAVVKGSPDGNSKDIFVLHEGTKVKVLNALGDWREVSIADGNQGWIESRAVALID